MTAIQKFEDIGAWKKARELTRAVYDITSKGRFAKDFALRDQFRHAAVSVMANIAEGFERNGDKEFIQFLSLAKGSSGEIRSHLYVAVDQRYISEEQFAALEAQAIEISQMISGLMQYLRGSSFRGNKYKAI